MPEFSVEIWNMILMGENKALDPALCRGSDPGLAPEILCQIPFSKKHLSSYDNIFETGGPAHTLFYPLKPLILITSNQAAAIYLLRYHKAQAQNKKTILKFHCSLFYSQICPLAHSMLVNYIYMLYLYILDVV